MHLSIVKKLQLRRQQQRSVGRQIHLCECKNNYIEKKTHENKPEK